MDFGCIGQGQLLIIYFFFERENYERGIFILFAKIIINKKDLLVVSNMKILILARFRRKDAELFRF